MKTVYADNAATTPVRKLVLKEMIPYFSEKYGNPSGVHKLSRDANLAVENGREKVSHYLGAKSTEIVFTSSATESISLFHKGFIERINESKKITKPHIITSSIEHKAVIETLRYMETKRWVNTTYLPVNKYGCVNVLDLKRSITPSTVLVSIMYVNNEIGSVQPIIEIGRCIKRINVKRKIKIRFFTDATQAMLYYDCNVQKLGVDALLFSGHKIYGPKGIGVLYVKGGVTISRMLHGGGQEYGRRAGTENVANIVGLVKALELAAGEIKTERLRVNKIRNRFIDKVRNIEDVKLMGCKKYLSPHISSFVVGGVEGEALVLHLSERGIYASSGSACTSDILKPSHVLLAMGLKAENAHGSIRFSFGKYNKMEDVEYIFNNFAEVIKYLRKMSPVFN